MEIFGEIHHIAYTSEKAQEIALSFGLTPGTAKDVARVAGRPLDLADPLSMDDTLDEADYANFPKELLDLHQMMKEVAILDHRLRPFEHIALDYGIMMTPVLLINGEVKHQGSVPPLTAIDQWLLQLK